MYTNDTPNFEQISISKHCETGQGQLSAALEREQSLSIDLQAVAVWRRAAIFSGKPQENHRKSIGKWWFSMGFFGSYLLDMSNIAMSNGHRNSRETWFFP